MPKVIILRSWPDDDNLQVIVDVEHSYPDELAEAARVAIGTFAEAHGIMLAAVDTED